MKRLLVVAIILFATTFLTACTSQSTDTDDSADVSGLSTSNNDSTSKVISSAELARNNGKNGNDCYVAVDGVVYEISGIAEWINGIHVTTSGVTCGNDHTQKIKESPHGRSVLSRLKVVGRLE